MGLGRLVIGLGNWVQVCGLGCIITKHPFDIVCNHKDQYCNLANHEGLKCKIHKVFTRTKFNNIRILQG